MRLTVGSEEHTQVLIAALREVVAELALQIELKGEVEA